MDKFIIDYIENHPLLAAICSYDNLCFYFFILSTILTGLILRKGVVLLSSGKYMQYFKSVGCQIKRTSVFNPFSEEYIFEYKSRKMSLSLGRYCYKLITVLKNRNKLYFYPENLNDGYLLSGKVLSRSVSLPDSNEKAGILLEDMCAMATKIESGQVPKK